MPFELTMPQLSDTMTEGTLVSWLKKEGDKIKAGEEIAEIETDKATMPMESAEAGVLAVVLVAEGGKVAVGAAVGVVATKGEDPAEVKKNFAAGAGAASAKAESKSESKAAEPATGGPGKSDSATPVAEKAGANVKDDAQPASNGHGDSRIKASPLAKRIAADSGVDLSNVTGSGPGGRIVQKDVLAASSAAPTASAKPGETAAPGKPAPELPARIASGQVEKIELSKMRMTIAQRLQQSKQQIPHFYETIDIDMTAAVELRKKLLGAYEKSEGIRVSIGDVVAKAVASTLRAVPILNSTFDGKTISRHGDVHLGMAVALPDGLIVPVLRSIDQMGIKEIRVKSADLVDRARKQRLKRDEMSGATFTVSNLGTMGIREFSAIVNPPEVGILAIGATEYRAVATDKGEIVAKQMMTVTLSADHRVVDGADAARFLSTLRSMLEEPAMMLA